MRRTLSPRADSWAPPGGAWRPASKQAQRHTADTLPPEEMTDGPDPTARVRHRRGNPGCGVSGGDRGPDPPAPRPEAAGADTRSAIGHVGSPTGPRHPLREAAARPAAGEHRRLAGEADP